MQQWQSLWSSFFHASWLAYQSFIAFSSILSSCSLELYWFSSLFFSTQFFLFQCINEASWLMIILSTCFASFSYLLVFFVQLFQLFLLPFVSFLATSWLLFHLDWLFSFVIVCPSCNVPIMCCSCYSFSSCTISFSIPLPAFAFPFYTSILVIQGVCILCFLNHLFHVCRFFCGFFFVDFYVGVCVVGNYN